MTSEENTSAPRLDFPLFVDSQAIARLESVEMLIILDILSRLSQVDEKLSDSTGKGAYGWIEHLPWISKKVILRDVHQFGIDNIDIALEMMKGMDLVSTPKGEPDGDRFRLTAEGIRRRVTYNKDQSSLRAHVTNLVKSHLPEFRNGISDESLYGVFVKACTNLVAQDIKNWVDFRFVVVELPQDFWLPPSADLVELSSHCDELATNWRHRSPSEHIDKFFLMCELYVLYAVATFENGVRRYLESLDSAILYLDTNVLVSLLIKEDRWHPITVAFLDRVRKINEQKKGGIIQLRISDMTLKELDYLFEHTENALRSLSFAKTEQEARDRYNSITKDNSIVLEFLRQRYPNIRVMYGEIGRRLSLIIRDHGIVVEPIMSYLDPGTAGKQVTRLCEELSGYRDRENIRHKVYLIRLAQVLTGVSRQAWIWSYNREQITVERMLLEADHMQYSIYGRYIRGILDPLSGSGIRLLQKDFSEYFLASALYHRSIDNLRSEVVRLKTEVIPAGGKRTGLSSDEQFRLFFALHMQAESEQATARQRRVDETLAAIRNIMSDGEVLPDEI